MRGFGFVFENGRVRNWYCNDDGVQKWADTDEPVTPPAPQANIPETGGGHE